MFIKFLLKSQRSSKKTKGFLPEATEADRADWKLQDIKKGDILVFVSVI